MAFGSIVFTTRGKVLQSKAQTGTKLNFTKLAIGDGELGSQSVLELTDLKNKKLDIPISSLKVLTGGLASVGGTFTNEDVESGFYWRELGLYAIDPDVGEILYCYGNAGALAEYIPSSGGSEILEKFVAIETIIGNAENVSAIINQSLVYATIEDIESHNSDPKAHSDIRVLIENINVQGDVEEVVNRRLNPDISKPLGTLISEWINTAKTAILNGINGLPQKSVWTDGRGAKLDNLDQSMTTTQTNINNVVNSARDNIKSHITSQIGSAKNDYIGRVATPYAFYQGDTKFQKGTNVITLASLSGSGVFILTKADIKYASIGGTSGMTYTHATEVIIDGKTYSDLILSNDVISLPIPFNTSLVIRRVVEISANTGTNYFNYAGTTLHGMLYR